MAPTQASAFSFRLFGSYAPALYDRIFKQIFKQNVCLGVLQERFTDERKEATWCE
jgi:hypothetical protein